jgi:paraquat-inducible protein B
MDFFPDTPIRLVGKEKGYPEIPTLPTAFQEITQALEALPLKDIAEQLLSMLNNLERLLTAPELMDTVRGFKTAVDNVNRLILTTDSVVADAGKLVDNLDNQVEPISKSLQAAAGDARKLLQGMDQDAGALAANARDALAAVSKTLQQVDRTLATYSGLVDERSEIRSGLSRAVQELAAAARSVGSLSEYLERHPEALLQGKSTGRGQ